MQQTNHGTVSLVKTLVPMLFTRPKSTCSPPMVVTKTPMKSLFCYGNQAELVYSS